MKPVRRAIGRGSGDHPVGLAHIYVVGYRECISIHFYHYEYILLRMD